ncbi:unnamed protein product, partial [Heterotrigona itama]
SCPPTTGARLSSLWYRPSLETIAAEYSKRTESIIMRLFAGTAC